MGNLIFLVWSLITQVDFKSKFYVGQTSYITSELLHRHMHSLF